MEMLFFMLFWGGIFSVLCAIVGKNKGYDVTLCAICGFLGGFICLIVLLMMKDESGAEREHDRRMKEIRDKRLSRVVARHLEEHAPPGVPMAVERFQCPECGESIPVAAKFCRFCNCILNDTDKANA